MLYRLRDLPAMLATPVGRMQVADGLLFRLWPLVWRGAWLYRRTAARRARAIVVVGSFGKSTTARAVAAAVGLPVHMGIVQNAYASVAHALLRIRPSQPRAVIEVGVGARGEMARYASMIRPDVVVVTAIGGEHSRAIGTVEDIREEKSAMVRALPATGAAVVNGDDPHALWMAARTRARVVTYGFGERCDVRATDVRLDWPEGTRFRVAAFGVERDAAVRLVGRHMVCAALAAIAVAHVEGLGLDATLARLRTLAPTPGRMQPVALPGGVTLLQDEFKATIETVQAALDAFAEVPAGRRLVLIGNLWDPPGDEALPTARSAPGSRRWRPTSSSSAAGSPTTARARRRPACRRRPSTTEATLRSRRRRCSPSCCSRATSCWSRAAAARCSTASGSSSKAGASAATSTCATSARCAASIVPMLEDGWGTRRMIVRAGTRR